jgi:PAS domain S-box-containing protein
MKTSRKKLPRAARAQVAGTAQDDELQKQSGTLPALFRCAPDAMLLVDADGRIAGSNDRAQTLFGCTGQELAGKMIESLMPARFRKLHVQERAAFAAAPNAREMGAGLALAARRKDGTEFPVDIMLSPVQMPGGRAVIATLRDITERRRAEEALWQEREDLERCVEERTAELARANEALRHAREDLERRVEERTAELARANEALREDAERLAAVIATQREIAGNVREFSDMLSLIAGRAQALTGASGAAIDLLEKNELVSRFATGIATRHVPVWLRIASDLARECFRTGEIFHCDDARSARRLDRAACRKVGLRSMIVVPLHHDGAAVGVLKVLSTEPRAFGGREERIAQLMAGLVGAALSGAALAESKKLASLSVLASGVAHEIRNPLTAIKARLYTHQKRLTPGSPEAADGEFVSEEIGRLERIVREFLQFARPGDPVFEAVSPAELLSEVRDLLAVQLAMDAIHLAVADTVETPVRADRQQIKQVLVNLVRNAAESIGRDGAITLRARRPGPGFGARDWDAVALEVKDTGPGIPPEARARLFDPFFTTKASGTGLGLSIAARIVEKHGGTLSFKTNGRCGTTFRLVLPAEKTP